MNKLLLTLLFSIGIAACSDNEHGPDADHAHAEEKQTESKETAVTPGFDAHGHEHAVTGHEGAGDEGAGDSHDHTRGDDHDHAPQTETFYGEEVESSEQDKDAVEAEPELLLHPHEEGDHDHHH